MSSMCEIVRRCIVAARNINPTIPHEQFIRALSSDDDNSNYYIFYKFAASCPSALLGALFCCGIFGGDRRIHEIAVDIVNVRSLFGEEVEDIGGLIQRLLQHPR